MSRNARLVPLLALVALTAACKPSAPSPAEAAVAPAEAAAAAPPPATVADVELPAMLKTGVGFPEARAALAAAGWLPLHDRADCMGKLGGRSALCYSTPELASCDDARCTLEFANADVMQRLSLMVGAPAGSDPDETPAFGAVKSWALSEIAATAPTGACPAADFDGFLKIFAADPLARAQYTAPLVRVAQMVDRGDAGDQSQQTYVAAGNYTGFALSYRDGAWYPLVDASAPRPAPLDVRISAEDGGAHYVSVPGNVEGVSYRFERHQDCWRLTGDPDAAI